MGQICINEGCHVKCGGDIIFVGVCGRAWVTHTGEG
jgi:hypothetical protein